MKTIAQQLNITDFPFEIKDKNGNQIYFETSVGYWAEYKYDYNGNRIYFENLNGYWCKREYDFNGDETYFQDSNGVIRGNRPKQTREGKVVEIDGKMYKLTAV